MCARLFNALTSLLGVSHTSTSTWWDLCILYAATLTCSLWWTVQHVALASRLPVQVTSLNSLVEWISCFRVPVTVTLDRGSQFTSSSWSAFCRSVGIQHVMTTAYHPQSNSMVERMHRWLKAALVAHRSSSSFPSELPWVLLSLRSVPLEQSGVSSAELVFGTPPTPRWKVATKRRDEYCRAAEFIHP